MKTLLLDNYDSFTYNLFQYLGELDANPVVFKNDEVSLDEISEGDYSHIVISPGPGRPDKKSDFGVCGEVIDKVELPILGVCLGMQGLVTQMGGNVVRAPEIIHGMTSEIEIISESKLFSGIDSGFEAMRYHSLMVEEPLPSGLVVTARSGDVVMALEHESKPLFGVQFHPESIGTEVGHDILRNFLV